MLWASSAWNNGYPGGYDDVRLYTGNDYAGSPLCLPNGTSFRLTFPYDNNIESHRWVGFC